MTVFDIYIIFMTAFGILTRFINLPQWVGDWRLMIGFMIGVIFFCLNVKFAAGWGADLKAHEVRSHNAIMLFGTIFITASLLKKYDKKYGNVQEEKE